MSNTTFVRKEKKYLISTVQREKLLELLPEFMKFDKYCRCGNMYTVNNVYFDNESYNVIRHSTSKPIYKAKIRIRSYKVNVTDDDYVFFEMKKKFQGVVNKRRLTIKHRLLEEYLNDGVFPSELSTQELQVLKEIDYEIKRENVKPKVYLTYLRTALYAKNDSSVRLTIDEDILARTDEPTLASNRYGDSLLPEGYYLMEIKVHGAFPLWLAHILSELRIFPTSFSKYGKFYENIVKGRNLNNE